MARLQRRQDWCRSRAARRLAAILRGKIEARGQRPSRSSPTAECRSRDLPAPPLGDSGVAERVAQVQPSLAGPSEGHEKRNCEGSIVVIRNREENPQCRTPKTARPEWRGLSASDGGQARHGCTAAARIWQSDTYQVDSSQRGGTGIVLAELTTSPCRRAAATPEGLRRGGAAVHRNVCAPFWTVESRASCRTHGRSCSWPACRNFSGSNLSLSSSPDFFSHTPRIFTPAFSPPLLFALRFSALLTPSL